MPEMKDSGIEWIGTIPKDWEIIPVKYFFKIGRGRVISVLDLDEDGIYPVYSSQTENNGCFGYLKTYDYSGPAITWTTDGVKAGTVFYRDGKYNCTNVCGILSFKNEYKDKSDIKFMTYAISIVAEQNKRKDINGYKIMSNEMANIRFAVPLFSVQNNITNYLDSKCAEIDSLYADIEKQIELLEQYKKSVITEAVTKGLDPNVEMKDSGIEWIGKIPNHWRILRIKYIMNSLDYLRVPVDAGKRSQEGDILYNYYGASGIIDKINGYTHVGRNILIGEDGANLLLRNLPLIYVADGKYWVNNHAHVINPKNGWSLDYFAHQMEIVDYFIFITGSAQPKLSQFKLNEVRLVVPSKSEQYQIADYLNVKCAEIDSAIADKKKQLETLEAYKKSLIYEYVTGKKEVQA